MSWDLAQWRQLDRRVRAQLLRSRSEAKAWQILAGCARSVLRLFSTSFFLVTRFLPPRQRADVEVIYASVRYPDEVVDTFRMTPAEQLSLLDEWERYWRDAQLLTGIRHRIAAGLPWILAGFAEVAARREIPPEHYRVFLEAMRRDARPRPFATVAELIDDYVYGSAVVVGYFLSHVYGPESYYELEDTLRCARELGIALQLTNFSRDVFEDHRRGRLYLPLDTLAAEGLMATDYMRPENEVALQRAVCSLAAEAEARYCFARQNLKVFAADCRPAIGACIGVYQELNTRILKMEKSVRRRASLSAWEKFRILPSDKYWRVPLAYAGLL